MTSPPSRVQVELLAMETVVAGGTRKATWLVHTEGDIWLSAARYPGAQLTQLEPGPGTIWKTSAVLELAPGTIVQRIVSTPLPERFADPLRYLKQERKATRRKTSRTYYRVARDGSLRRTAPATP